MYYLIGAEEGGVERVCMLMFALVSDVLILECSITWSTGTRAVGSEYVCMYVCTYVWMDGSTG